MAPAPAAKPPPFVLRKRPAQQEAHSDRPAKRPFISSRLNDIITINVKPADDSEESKSFAVESSVLAAVSPRLNRTKKGSLLGSETSTSLTITCCRPEVFEMYLSAITNVNGWRPENFERLAEVYVFKDSLDEWTSAARVSIQLWMLGHQIGDQRLCNMVMDVLMDNQKLLEDDEMPELLACCAGSELNADCCLMRWAIDTMVNLEKPWHALKTAQFPERIVEAVMNKLVQERASRFKTGKPWLANAVEKQKYLVQIGAGRSRCGCTRGATPRGTAFRGVQPKNTLAAATNSI